MQIYRVLKAVYSSLAFATEVTIFMMASPINFPVYAEEQSAVDIPSTTIFRNYFFHDVYDDGSNLFALASMRKQPATFLLDPDGTKAFLSYLYLIKIDRAGTITKVLLGDIRPNGDMPTGSGALLVEGNRIFAFHNSKETNNTYDMSGYLYEVNTSSMTLAKITTIFSNKNWGWFPVIDSGPSVRHFSFDGYLRYENSSNKGYIDPNKCIEEWNRFRVNHSNGRLTLSDIDHINSSKHSALVNVLTRDISKEKLIEAELIEYRESFKNAHSISDFDRFISTYRENDPDRLIPKAETMKQAALKREAAEARARELAAYRDTFKNAHSSSDFENFISTYRGKDPDKLIPKAEAKKRVALAQERKEAERQQREDKYRRAHACDHLYVGKVVDAPVTGLVNLFGKNSEKAIVLGFSNRNGVATVRSVDNSSMVGELSCESLQ